MLQVFCGLMAFLGHLFPIYLSFKGGKGVATGLGVSAALHPPAAAVALGVWLVVLAPFRYVSLSSVIAAVTLPAAYALLEPKGFEADRLPIAVFFVLGAVFVIVKHIPNLRRLARGEEPKILQRKHEA